MLDNIGGMQGLGQSQFDITTYPNEKCDKCGCFLFKSAIILKKIPGVALGAGTEEITYPVKVFVCSECGEILLNDRKDLKLKEFKEDKQIEEKTKSSLLIV